MRAVDAGTHDHVPRHGAAADLYVVAGGDGTVGKVITGIRDRNIPVAIIPSGTANNIAKSLCIEGSLDTLVDCHRDGGAKLARQQRWLEDQASRHLGSEAGTNSRMTSEPVVTARGALRTGR